LSPCDTTPLSTRKATVDAVLREIQQYSAGEQRDDITLIVARCKGKRKPGKKKRAR